MLCVRKLVKVYPGPVTALQGIDLDLPVCMFGLLGPNGAGKTTFMRILAGLLVPTVGRARVLDTDLSDADALFRRRVAFVVGGERSCHWPLKMSPQSRR